MTSSSTSFTVSAAEEIRLRINLRSNRSPEIGKKVVEPETATSCEQESTEHMVHKAYEERSRQYQQHCMRLCKYAHLAYLKERLIKLPQSTMCLDASQPWLLYWILHALKLLHYQPSHSVVRDCFSLLRTMQNKSGGFGGGPHQLSHLATTYAAVNALAELNCPEALEVIDRTSLHQWLLSLRNEPEGSFRMHDNGETDVRGCYCALAVAAMCNVMDEPLTHNTAQWIAACQTYEGGFGGAPGLEAHGGYTFCAVASLVLLDALHLVDIPLLLRWASNRQMAMEGGFQGRTNKLVDSCYSFWVGGIFALIQPRIRSSPCYGAGMDRAVTGTFDIDAASNSDFMLMDWLFDSTALQDYILICCQRYPVRGPVPSSNHPILSVMEGGANSGGGLIDKPGKNPDAYHTCYALSGLSLAQHPPFRGLGRNSEWTSDSLVAEECAVSSYGSGEVAVENAVSAVVPLFNITMEAYEAARAHFYRASTSDSS